MPGISPSQRTALWNKTHPDYSKNYTAQYRLDHPNYHGEWVKKNRTQHNELSRKHMQRYLEKKDYYSWEKISKIFRKILL